MAVCPDSCWVRLLPTAVAALVLLVAPAAAGDWAKDLTKWPGREAAVEQARKQGKLLLAIHVSAEFTQNPSDSREAKLYQQAALADPRVELLLETRFVPTLRAVGETKHLRLKRTDKAAAQDMAIAYVCLPDERVLHFIPGFVSPADLLAELTWAEQCYAAMVKAPAYEQPLAVRRIHLAGIAKADLAAFMAHKVSRWNADRVIEGESTVELAETAARARATFDASLANRLGPHWQRVAGSEGLAALAVHGSIAGDLSHLLLSEHPLAPLGDLAPAAYAACTGRRMFSSPKRRAELAAWWALTSKAGRASLLVVAADDFYKVTAIEIALRPAPPQSRGDIRRSITTATITPQVALEWPLRNAGELPDLSRLAVQVVSLDELSLLLADSGLPEVNYTRGQPLRYLLHDAQGFRVAELTGGEASTSRLAQAIKGLELGPPATSDLAR